jgi:hypothetical protein
MFKRFMKKPPIQNSDQDSASGDDAISKRILPVDDSGRARFVATIDIVDYVKNKNKPGYDCLLTDSNALDGLLHRTVMAYADTSQDAGQEVVLEVRFPLKEIVHGVVDDLPSDPSKYTDDDMRRLRALEGELLSLAGLVGAVITRSLDH